MTETRLIFHASSALLLCTAAGISQTPAPAPAATVAQAQAVAPSVPKPPPALYRNLIVLDPAHGGTDTGAHLPDDVLEKSVTLAFAQKLRPALAAQGFTVISTRDSDPPDSLPTDQRAGNANHARPLACLLLHATASGSGIHIASSSQPSSDDVTPRVLRWSDAQAGMSAISLRLANETGLAVSNAHLPVILLRASVPPIDSLTCPAIIVEIAPLTPSGGSRSPVTDTAYQQKVAEAVALGLASFRTHNAPPPAPPAPISRPAPSVNTPAGNPPAPTAPESSPTSPKPADARPSAPATPPGAGATPKPSNVKPTAPAPSPASANPASTNPGAKPR